MSLCSLCSIVCNCLSLMSYQICESVYKEKNVLRSECHTLSNCIFKLLNKMHPFFSSPLQSPSLIATSRSSAILIQGWQQQHVPSLIIKLLILLFCIENAHPSVLLYSLCSRACKPSLMWVHLWNMNWIVKWCLKVAGCLNQGVRAAWIS